MGLSGLQQYQVISDTNQTYSSVQSEHSQDVRYDTIAVNWYSLSQYKWMKL